MMALLNILFLEKFETSCTGFFIPFIQFPIKSIIMFSGLQYFVKVLASILIFPHILGKTMQCYYSYRK